MEQYLNLVWKNYTATLAENSDGDPFDDSADLFVNNELHYNIPFWVGATVIVLLLLSAIVATIRYCIFSLCSSSSETEKVALVPGRSPYLSSSVATTGQRRRREIPDTVSHQLSDETHLSTPEQIRNQHAVSITHAEVYSQFRSMRQHRAHIDLDSAHSHYLSSDYIPPSRTPNDLRRKAHGIYMLPVSPALSSSSSITRSDEMRRTTPVRSRRHLPGSAIDRNESSLNGVKNACFADSPQPKSRTLPRSLDDHVRRVQAPAQPPPLPPAVLPLQLSENQPQSSYLYHACQEKLEHHRPMPPPVPLRSQKPVSIVPIVFDGVRQSPASSPQDDRSEQAWPNPPESMATSQISGPLPIPYDHLIPTIIMHQTGTMNHYPQHQYHEHMTSNESET